MKNLEDKVILITGGSGFLGNAIADRLEKVVKELRVFSRDESLQEKMMYRYPRVKYILGDVRDYDSLKNALKGVDIVVHAAAVKYLNWAEVQPSDCVKTNIIGSMNLIKACLDNDVKICVGCSTDKAPEAVNVYGCSKQIMEALFKEANQYNSTKFLITRYGNVIGSTGSVIPKWLRCIEDNRVIYVTSKDMRRFFMTVDDAVDCVLKVIDTEENYIPTNLKAINMWHLAELIAKDRGMIIESELRPGERKYEILSTEKDGKIYTTNEAEDFTDEEILKLIYAIHS